ncbi:hypothetical protein C8Q76DRAFT_768217 [Earliella scabrosa]|nr:hypothetical protein C8Q76DRAFT_768217 [Earliella scabrosa]
MQSSRSDICHNWGDLARLTRFSKTALVSLVQQMQVFPRDVTPTQSKPTRVVRFLRAAQLTEAKFSSILRDHRPLVVTGMQEYFQLRWTPQWFIEQFGDVLCDVEDCETGTLSSQTILQFFSLFGQANHIKDVFPQLQEEFERLVPLPAYTTPTGTRNLAAHFPENSVQPDLGPKLYCALGSVVDDVHSGSTRLHLDMSDAVNILTYASTTYDGSAGHATWHIFAPEDSKSIRAFLRARHDARDGDPIHNQEYYLTPSMLRELEAQYSVRPYTIRQRVGQAVFIPAGCAHQVANLADCVKIACDFISQESVSICQILSAEFRLQRLARRWPSDVIPFASMLYYTWTSTTLLRSMMLSALVSTLGCVETPRPEETTANSVSEIPITSQGPYP